MTKWSVFPCGNFCRKISHLVSHESTEFCKSITKCQWKYFFHQGPGGDGSREKKGHGGRRPTWPPEVCHAWRMGAQLACAGQHAGQRLPARPTMVSPAMASYLPSMLAEHQPLIKELHSQAIKEDFPVLNFWVLLLLFYLLDFLGPRPRSYEIPGAQIAESPKQTIISSNIHMERRKTWINKCFHKAPQSIELSQISLTVELIIHKNFIIFENDVQVRFSHFARILEYPHNCWEIKANHKSNELLAAK